MSVTRTTRTCALDGCEVAFTFAPSDDQKYCSVAHAREGVPAFRDTAAALRTCALNGCTETFRARWPSDPKRYHSHTCAAAARRQDECGKCGGDDWLVKANGKRACRPCKGRRTAEWRKRDGRQPDTRRRVNGARVRVTPQPSSPLPVEIPDAPVVERPVWRPAGFTPTPHVGGAA